MIDIDAIPDWVFAVLGVIIASATIWYMFGVPYQPH